MLPPRKKRNSSRTNLIISTIFHTVIIVALFYFAAREGMLGKKLKTLAAQIVPKEKPPEKPKEPEKPPEPPKEVVETPKAAAPPKVEAPKAVRTVSAPPAVAPAAAPPAGTVPAFDFDGGKIVQTTSDPAVIYKGMVEWALRSKWNRPEDTRDDSYVAEVELMIDPTGKLIGSDWKKGSGDAKWDESVRRVLAQVKSFSRPPPKGFPPKVLVRFDVQQETETIIQ